MHVEKKEYRIVTTSLLPVCDYSQEEVGDPSGAARKSVRYIVPNNLMAGCAPAMQEHRSFTAAKPEK